MRARTGSSSLKTVALTSELTRPMPKRTPLEIALANQFRDDRVAYNSAKTDLVEHLTNQALDAFNA